MMIYFSLVHFTSLHIPQKRTEGEYRISLHMSISSFHRINLLSTTGCDAAR